MVFISPLPRYKRYSIFPCYKFHMYLAAVYKECEYLNDSKNFFFDILHRNPRLERRKIDLQNKKVGSIKNINANVTILYNIHTEIYLYRS